jgi:hypothetical protein
MYTIGFVAVVALCQALAPHALYHTSCDYSPERRVGTRAVRYDTAHSPTTKLAITLLNIELNSY